MPDLVITNVTAVTMDGQRRILRNAWISVTGNRIEAIGEGEPQAGPARVIDGRGGVALPGFISTHQHLIDSLVRGGLQQDRNLIDWLINVYYGAISAYRPEDCATAVTLNVAEAIRSGVTTVCDGWGVNNGDDPGRVSECTEATLDVYRRTGIRVMFARMLQDVFPDYWQPLAGALLRKIPGLRLRPETLVEDTDGGLSRIESLMSKHHKSENDRIHVCPSPVLPQTASPQALAGCLELAERFDTMLTIHLCESLTDARMFTESGWGMTCTDYLNCLGFLSGRLVAAHCVHLTDRDLRYFKVNDVKVAHCPSSNLNLASGIARVPQMVLAGITVGLGTDDTSTNCNVSILTEMRDAALLQRGVSFDAGVLSAEKALEMATIDGARALGLADEIGSLEAGKKADIILFDTDKPHWYPRHHLPAVLAYQAQASDIHTVIIDGRPVMEDRELAFLKRDEEPAFYERAQRTSEDVVERAGMQSLLARGWQSESRV
ncbi:MAG: 5-methylthioadenosine/S-adenosylhomocysteine deaminase [Cryptosporangiaceae bacterium]|nr:5-methylthioadenosine/S-adenosylhomocysteine deaminase [Cryptosporangiaceae bacterium]